MKALVNAAIYASSQEWTPPQYTLLPVPSTEVCVWESDAADSMPPLHLEGITTDKPQPDCTSSITLPVPCSWTSVLNLCLILSITETQLSWKTHLLTHSGPHSQGDFWEVLLHSVTSGLKALTNTMPKAEKFNLLL